MVERDVDDREPPPAMTTSRMMATSSFFMPSVTISDAAA